MTTGGQVQSFQVPTSSNSFLSISVASSSFFCSSSFAATVPFASETCFLHSSALLRRASAFSASESTGAFAAASAAAFRLAFHSAAFLFQSATSSESSAFITSAWGFLTTSTEASESSSATSSSGRNSDSASSKSLSSPASFITMAWALPSFTALAWKKLAMLFTSSLSTFVNSTVSFASILQNTSLTEFSAPALRTSLPSGIIAPLALRCP
mmetsp:Transcript_75755/g.162491  ORF Transcript_75755/g.162491 Transcript_75755/m.162491 type:complete len:212 (-) Transcript_75755:670-1305(-)